MAMRLSILLRLLCLNESTSLLGQPSVDPFVYPSDLYIDDDPPSGMSKQNRENASAVPQIKSCFVQKLE
jgi:hypothetical protein